jgi:hypothetical protein
MVCGRARSITPFVQRRRASCRAFLGRHILRHSIFRANRGFGRRHWSCVDWKLVQLWRASPAGGSTDVVDGIDWGWPRRWHLPLGVAHSMGDDDGHARCPQYRCCLARYERSMDARLATDGTRHQDRRHVDCGGPHVGRRSRAPSDAAARTWLLRRNRSPRRGLRSTPCSWAHTGSCRCRIRRRGPFGRDNRCSGCRAVRNLFEKFLKSNVQHADTQESCRWQCLMVLRSTAAVGSPEDLARAR